MSSGPPSASPLIRRMTRLTRAGVKVIVLNLFVTTGLDEPDGSKPTFFVNAVEKTNRSNWALRTESVVSDPSEVHSGPIEDLQVNLRLA